MTTTLSSRDFARDVSRAKRAARSGVVFVTHRGKPAYALLSIERYRKLAGAAAPSLFEAMRAIPGGRCDFEPPRADDLHFNTPDLS